MRHPLRFLTSSRVGLAITALVTTGMLLSYSVWAERFLLQESRSDGWNGVFILCWIFLIFVAGLFDALLIGDVLLPEGWRDKLMFARGQSDRVLGRSDLSEDDEILDDARRFRSYTVHFSFFVVATTVLNMLIAGVASGGLFWKLHEAQLSTMLRSEDPQDRLFALEQVGSLSGEKSLAGFTGRAVELVDDSDPAVVHKALETVTRIAWRMRAREGERNSWQAALFEQLRDEQAPVFLARFRHDEVNRAHLAMALGALKYVKALEVFEARLDGGDPETVAAIVVAARDMVDVRALPLILSVLRGEGATQQAHAAWALGELLSMYKPTGREEEAPAVQEALETMRTRLGEMSFEGQCALVEALARVKDAGMAEGLFELFDAPNVEAQCPGMLIARVSRPPDKVIGQEVLRLKVLFAIAAIGGRNAEVADWLSKRVEQGGLSPFYESELRNMKQSVQRSWSK